MAHKLKPVSQSQTITRTFHWQQISARNYQATSVSNVRANGIHQTCIRLSLVSIRVRSLVVSDLRSESKRPPPSSAVLWFVNVLERKPRQKKKTFSLFLHENVATIVKKKVKAKVAVTVLKTTSCATTWQVKQVRARAKHIRTRVIKNSQSRTQSNQTEFEMIQCEEPERASMCFLRMGVADSKKAKWVSDSSQRYCRKQAISIWLVESIPVNSALLKMPSSFMTDYF